MYCCKASSVRWDDVESNDDDVSVLGSESFRRR